MRAFSRAASVSRAARGERGSGSEVVAGVCEVTGSLGSARRNAVATEFLGNAVNELTIGRSTSVTEGVSAGIKRSRK